MSNLSFERLVPVLVIMWIVLGIANIVNDWVFRRWISPVSLGFLAALAAALVMLLLVRPVITAVGMKERIGIMVGVLVTTLFFVALNLLQLWLR